MPLQITESAKEVFDEDRQEFVDIPKWSVTIEHSLISVFKWEAIYKKSFIETCSKGNLTGKEMYDYIKCMTIGPEFPDDYYANLSTANIVKIRNYINDPMSATIMYNDGLKKETHKKSKDIMTAEYLYWAIFANQISKEVEKWHFNRLLKLLEIFASKNEQASGGNKKVSKNDIYARNAELNKRNRAKFHSKG